MQDRSLWQLCDAGLGWTRFQNTEPHWVEHPTIQPYLPADITPRPKDIKPWEYELKLKAGAVLWVKPGKRPKTFRWGVRTRTEAPNKDLNATSDIRADASATCTLDQTLSSPNTTRHYESGRAIGRRLAALSRVTRGYPKGIRPLPTVPKGSN